MSIMAEDGTALLAEDGSKLLLNINLGLTPPTYIAGSASVYNLTSTPIATGSLTLLTGDVVVSGLAVADERAAAENYNWTALGGGTWTEVGPTSGTVTADVYMAGAHVITTGGASSAVSVARAAGDVVTWGHTAAQFRNSPGVGAVSIKSGVGGNPTGTITTLYDNSAIVVFMSEYSAVDASAAIWQTINGVTPAAGSGEILKATTAGQYTNAAAVYSDAGAAGMKTFGFTTNVGTDWQWIAFEVRGQ